MISPRRIPVGVDPVDLTEGSRTSAVSIQYLRNAADVVLWIGRDGEDPIPLGPGEVFPMQLQLTAQDHLEIFRREADIEASTQGRSPRDVFSVDVIVGWA